ncbi:MAG: GTP 3',8-cyclase MoaA [Acidobacteriota bacterium]|nr:GTP 3',8-cyclase MoaA [Acidobacteriota bacterium]MDH3785488.1 GTP 3',8-cyclase MoaA [Acidobacteriota bacterium]
MAKPTPANALVDSYGRVHDDLRISVTDRCNLRCHYCMPVDPDWFPREEILSYEEMMRVVRIVATMGVRKVRLTGGEPLVRRDISRFVAMLNATDEVQDLSLTTNGLLLDRLAEELAAAGLRRVNVSLDTLDAARFAAVTRRDALQKVIEGLRAATSAGLSPIKINAVLVRGSNDDEIESLAEYARDHGWELRFIECMPLDNDRRWEPDRVVTGQEVRDRISRRWPIEPKRRDDPSSPAARWQYVDGRGSVGFIDSVSQPFCSTCSRLRLTADGKFMVCLYDNREIDLKQLLRSGADDRAIGEAIRAAVAGKGRGGALDLLERKEVLPASRSMHQIGG